MVTVRKGPHLKNVHLLFWFVFSQSVFCQETTTHPFFPPSLVLLFDVVVVLHFFPESCCQPPPHPPPAGLFWPYLLRISRLQLVFFGLDAVLTVSLQLFFLFSFWRLHGFDGKMGFLGAPPFYLSEGIFPPLARFVFYFSNKPGT